MSDAIDARAEKERLRHQMRARRRALSKEEVAERSAKICEHILALPEFRTAHTVCLYIPFDNEVDTLPLLKSCLGQKRIVGTRTLPGGHLELREIQSIDDLKKGAYSILEPKESCPLIAPSEVDIFLVPGTAFDRQNTRLGFGGGHFDRLLHQVRGHLVGVAYSFQVMDKLPSEPHDIPMHRVVHD